jgi:hypothetical protein
MKDVARFTLVMALCGATASCTYIQDNRSAPAGLPPGFGGDGGLPEGVDTITALDHGQLALVLDHFDFGFGVEIAASGEVWGKNTFAGWGLSLVLQYEWAPSSN